MTDNRDRKRLACGPAALCRMDRDIVGVIAADKDCGRVIAGACLTILLGSMSPVMLFFASQCPAPGARNAMSVYRVLLFAHTAMVGLCGIIGNVRLYALLKALTHSTGKSLRILLSWILVSGFAGCQLSWLASPFLARPDVPVPFLNPNAFRGNFFEYLWDNITRLY